MISLILTFGLFYDAKRGKLKMCMMSYVVLINKPSPYALELMISFKVYLFAGILKCLIPMYRVAMNERPISYTCENMDKSKEEC